MKCAMCGTQLPVALQRPPAPRTPRNDQKSKHKTKKILKAIKCTKKDHKPKKYVNNITKNQQLRAQCISCTHTHHTHICQFIPTPSHTHTHKHTKNNQIFNMFSCILSNVSPSYTHYRYLYIYISVNKYVSSENHPREHRILCFTRSIERRDAANAPPTRTTTKNDSKSTQDTTEPQERSHCLGMRVCLRARPLSPKKVIKLPKIRLLLSQFEHKKRHQKL